MINVVDLPQVNNPAAGLSNPSREQIAVIRKQNQAILPSSLHITSDEQREKILAEDKEKRQKLKEAHKMAPFRIEVQFGSTRSSKGESDGLIRVWESAKKLTGDGDVTMHFCGNPNCHLPFSAQQFSGDVVTCPHCFQTFARDDCPAGLGPFRRSVPEIALLLERMFMLFKGRCDIVCVWGRSDIRQLVTTSTMETYYEDKVENWTRLVYPYYNIIKDTMHGQSISNRIREFLS